MNHTSRSKKEKSLEKSVGHQMEHTQAVDSDAHS